MSWFCKRPKPKNTPRKVPKFSSPLTEHYRQRAKETAPEKLENKIK